MRLGGPIFKRHYDANSWVEAVKATGYRSVVFPLENDAEEQQIAKYRQAAETADILIAEVGAWSNPISKDGETRHAAIEHCKKQLDLAEKVSSRCCVNIAGSRAVSSQGPDRDNFTEETFEMIVETTREIIDAVKPKHTFFALEMMPWIFPDSADTYLELIHAIDRKQFAVHFDPVNIINSPRKYYSNAFLIKEFVSKLGPFIKSCHAKDVIISKSLTIHIDETIPGDGELDYGVFLSAVNKLDPNMPLLLEHLSAEDEYIKGANYIRGIAQGIDVIL